VRYTRRLQGVTACRNCQMRPNSGLCDDRRSRRLAISETASAARRAGMSLAATWRRHTDVTSRSMSSGAAKVSSAKRPRAPRPSVPSSPSGLSVK
jgi:hypothetical protein